MVQDRGSLYWTWINCNPGDILSVTFSEQDNSHHARDFHFHFVWTFTLECQSRSGSGNFLNERNLNNELFIVRREIWIQWGKTKLTRSYPSPECTERQAVLYPSTVCVVWFCVVSSLRTVFYGYDWHYRRNSHGLNWQPGNTQPTCHVLIRAISGQWSMCHHVYYTSFVLTHTCVCVTC